MIFYGLFNLPPSRARHGSRLGLGPAGPALPYRPGLRVTVPGPPAQPGPGADAGRLTRTQVGPRAGPASLRLPVSEPTSLTRSLSSDRDSASESDRDSLSRTRTESESVTVHWQA